MKSRRTWFLILTMVLSAYIGATISSVTPLFAQTGGGNPWKALPQLEESDGFKTQIPGSWGRLVCVNTIHGQPMPGHSTHQLWFEAQDGTIRMATGTSSTLSNAHPSQNNRSLVLHSGVSKTTRQ